MRAHSPRLSVVSARVWQVSRLDGAGRACDGGLVKALMTCLCVAGALVGCKPDSGRLLAVHNTELVDPGVLSSAPAVAAEVNVPVYSRLVYSEGIHLELSALLTVRNTDPQQAIVLESVRYYDSKGNNLRNELPAAGKLGPMATASFLVKKSDDAGGEGASYVVRWRSDALVSEPIVEAVMAEVSGSQSLAFVSRGQTTRTTHGVPLTP